MADTIVAKVYRYDPSVDAEPYYATYVSSNPIW